MRVYQSKCDVCGKLRKDGESWAHLEAEKGHDYSLAQAMIQGGMRRGSLQLSGARSLQTSDGVDLCSPACAGKWVFG